jgi:hypothetical protein
MRADSRRAGAPMRVEVMPGSMWVCMLRLALSMLLALGAAGVRAEPYFAVQTGHKCVQCHVNGTGGGMRTPFGNLFAQTQLAANKLDTGDASWLGNIGTFFGLGANVRSALTVTDVPGAPQTNQFDLQEARVYFSFTPIPNRLAVYIDQWVAPGSSLNREAFVRYSTEDGQYYIKGGRLYLPFGWRLQDEGAFVRTESGVNMSGSDTGVEVGWDGGPMAVRFAVSNGTSGGPEVDKSKQYSLQTEYVADAWRLGVAGNFNDAAAGDRSVLGVFAGLRTGPVSWLAEFDSIDDRSFIPIAGRKRRSSAWLAEGNWRFVQGHNLKLTAEYLDPDQQIADNRQTRYSAVYEYSPIQYLQLRGGVRQFDGPLQFATQNRRLYFLEMHGFF